jgi:hypothetical protein
MGSPSLDPSRPSSSSSSAVSRVVGNGRISGQSQSALRGLFQPNLRRCQPRTRTTTRRIEEEWDALKLKNIPDGANG